MSNNLYTDISTFQGWLEFEAEYGVWVRAEALDNDRYGVYVRLPDSTGFVRAATVKDEIGTPRSIWHAYLDTADEQE